MNRKASNQVGIGIIAMALLLLLGGIFFDSGTQTSNQNNIKNSDKTSNETSDYLFHVEDMSIGKQKKITQNFPNIILGAKEEYKTIKKLNTFNLYANPVTSNSYSTPIQFKKKENLQRLLLYFNKRDISGDQKLIVKVNGKEILKTSGETMDLPIMIHKEHLPNNITNSSISIGIDKPSWYDIFNWNKKKIKDMRFVAVTQNENNKERNFNFQLDKENLDRVTVNLLPKCEEVEEVSAPVKIEVNGYIISNENIDCQSRYNDVEAKIPQNILKEDKNNLTFSTNGYYKLAYRINKIYYNEKQKYQFTVNDFSNINDVVMYGNFDKEVVDLRINGQTISLQDREVKSIIENLEFGTNTIEFITKPVSLEEFTIEKNEFWN